tara:strand:+ start:1449 stop:1562 length:114 start_codon:yes stop_codon:yes gene_type:complete
MKVPKIKTLIAFLIGSKIALTVIIFLEVEYYYFEGWE